jgi:hypothetical protein
MAKKLKSLVSIAFDAIFDQGTGPWQSHESVPGLLLFVRKLHGVVVVVVVVGAKRKVGRRSARAR